VWSGTDAPLKAVRESGRLVRPQRVTPKGRAGEDWPVPVVSLPDVNLFGCSHMYSRAAGRRRRGGRWPGDHRPPSEPLPRCGELDYCSYTGTMAARASVCENRLKPRKAGLADSSTSRRGTSTACTTNM